MCHSRLLSLRKHPDYPPSHSPGPTAVCPHCVGTGANRDRRPALFLPFPGSLLEVSPSGGGGFPRPSPCGQSLSHTVMWASFLMSFPICNGMFICVCFSVVSLFLCWTLSSTTRMRSLSFTKASPCLPA